MSWFWEAWLWKVWAVRSPEGVTVGFRLPRSWKRIHDASAPLAFRNDRDDSLFQITPFPREQSAKMRGKLREAVAGQASRMAGQSVGDHVELFGIGGEGIDGWYFIASDRNVKPGEWAHMLSGMVEIDRLVMSFTVLSHQRPRMGEGDALRAFNYLRVKNA
jgi:hypothetical protein